MSPKNTTKPRTGTSLFETPAPTLDNEVLFKYRSIQNWKFLLDIFLNKRLYAATYKELNDPMEGRYYYHGDAVSREFKRALRDKRREWKICSLSRNHRNTLMWSYYAEGHRGIAIGITVKNKRRSPYTVREVVYDSEVHIGPGQFSGNAEQIALHILSQKQMAWQHEDEVRVFTRDQFVDVEIQKVCFGYYTSPRDRDLISALVKVTAPQAQLVHLERRQLDQPIDRFKASRSANPA
jgi:hypothetical protein